MGQQPNHRPQARPCPRRTPRQVHHQRRSAANPRDRPTHRPAQRSHRRLRQAHRPHPFAHPIDHPVAHRPCRLRRDIPLRQPRPTCRHDQIHGQRIIPQRRLDPLPLIWKYLQPSPPEPRLAQHRHHSRPRPVHLLPRCAPVADRQHYRPHLAPVIPAHRPILRCRPVAHPATRLLVSSKLLLFTRKDEKITLICWKALLLHPT